MKNKISDPKNKKNLIMVDCFGVISSQIVVDWIYEHFGKVKGKELDEKYSYLGDMGYISLFEYASEMAKLVGEDPHELYWKWINSAIINFELIKMLQKLRKEAIVVIASNASKGLVEDVFKSKNVDKNKFDHIFLSYKFHKVKPHLDFYQYIISSFDQNFDHIYMIDDRKINLEKIHELGVIPILFKDNNKLKEDIKTHFKENIDQNQ